MKTIYKRYFATKADAVDVASAILKCGQVKIKECRMQTLPGFTEYIVSGPYHWREKIDAIVEKYDDSC